MSGAVLSIVGASKSFFGVPVLKNVSLTLGGGRVLGLVGQNGAGKSTLMNIVGGNVTADGGMMQLNGARYAPSNAREAERRGVAFIHQELNLFTNLTIFRQMGILHQRMVITGNECAAACDGCG